MVVCKDLTTLELITESKTDLTVTLHVGTETVPSQPIRCSISGRPDTALHLTHIHMTDHKSMVVLHKFASLPPPELIPGDTGKSARRVPGKISQTKTFFFEAAFGPPHQTN